jgi:uncharacterized protein (UPF0248 family)
MTPIQDLLNRIRWDEHYSGDFVIDYYDRVAATIVRAPLAQVSFPPGDHFAFTVVDAEGAAHSVPYHRVREVFRDGALIWERHPP